MSNLGIAIEKMSIEKAKLQCIKSLMKTMHFTAQQAMDALEIPKDDQARYAAKLESNN